MNINGEDQVFEDAQGRGARGRRSASDLSGEFSQLALEPCNGRSSRLLF
jgi:hypothetical protein